MSFGSPSQSTAQGDTALGQGWLGGAQPAQPQAQAGAQVYRNLLQQVAADPKRLADPAFQKQLFHAAATIGRKAPQVQQDLQQAKAQSQTAQPSQQPATPGPGNTGAPSPQGTGMAPAGPQGAAPMGGGPQAGPRIDVNAWTGRQLSLQDFSTLSSMPPQERQEALRQQGYDLGGFDKEWLNSNPTVSPYEQAEISEHIATQIGQGIKEGDDPALIKERIAPLMTYLTPDQKQAINDSATADVNTELQARIDNWQQTGLLKAGTLALMQAKFSQSKANTAWDHDFRLTVLSDKNAQFSQEQSVRAQNANTNYGRLQEEIARDKQNGGSGAAIKTPELLTQAKGLLTSINGAISEMNGHIISATSAGVIDPKHPGVNPMMGQQVQQQIDAYNSVVDMLKARGVNIYSHYTGPDQSAVNAAAAGQTAAQAVTAQGMHTPGQPPFKVPPGYKAQQRNGKWGVLDSKGAWYPAPGG